MTRPIDITAADFDREVLKSDTPVLVDFWAAWCGPCVMMAPVLDELANELEGKLKVVKIDVDAPENLELAQSYSIRSIPNMKLFRGGKVAKEFIGVRPKEVLIQELELP